MEPVEYEMPGCLFQLPCFEDHAFLHLLVELEAGSRAKGSTEWCEVRPMLAMGDVEPEIGWSKQKQESAVWS